MTDTATIRLSYADADFARKVHAALAPDDDAFCATRVDGADVMADLRAEGVRSLLRAADDWLACAAAAEDVIKRA